MQKIILLTLSVLVTLIKFSTSQATELDHEYIQQASTSMFDELVDIRRDIHEHPEASGDEKRTAGIVASYLAKLGLDVKKNVGGYGVVGILRGKENGKIIAWRADMDASFASHDRHVPGQFTQNTLTHNCGHDVHTSIGLGIASVFAPMKDQLNGSIVFLFQPAEETQQGAMAMIADGVLSLTKPDEVYGLHIGPFESGVISTITGNLFAHTRRIQLNFKDLPHTEELQNTLNTIAAALTDVRSPKIMRPLNMIDDETGLLSPQSIYRDYVLFQPEFIRMKNAKNTRYQAEVFANDRAELDSVVAALSSALEASQYRHHFNLTFFDERQGVNNNAELVDQSMNVLSKLYGPDAVQPLQGRVPFSSEDFGHFQKSIPGVYFLLGGSNQKAGKISMPHMPGFTVDEKSIGFGVSRFSSLILERINNSVVEN